MAISSNTNTLNQLANLIEGVSVPMLIANSEGEILACNRHTEKPFGKSQHQLLGETLQTIGFDLHWLKQDVFTLSSSQMPFGKSVMLGSYPVQVVFNRLAIDQQVFYSFSFNSFKAVDFTSKSPLLNNESCTRFIENSSLPIVFLDPHTYSIEYANEQATNFFQLPASKLVGIPLAKLTQMPVERLNESITSFVHNGYSGLEVSFKTETDRRDAALHFSSVSIQEQPFVLCLLVDITQQNQAFFELHRIKNNLSQEVAMQTKDLVRVNNSLLEQIKNRKRIEEELRQSQELFIHLFRLNPSGLVLRDGQTKGIIEVNRSFLQMFNLTSSAVKGKTIEDLGLICNTNEYNTLLAGLQTKGKNKDVSLTMMTANGHALFVVWSGELVRVNNREYILEVFNDTTQVFFQIRQTRVLSEECTNPYSNWFCAKL